MADCEHLARTSAYFDGELPDAEHADALAHLASCDDCQQVLGTAVVLDATLSQRSKLAAREEPRVADELQARRARKKWPVVAVAAALAAAAAVVVFLPGGHPDRPMHDRDELALELAQRLPAERGVAVRFSSEPFLAHRPYSPLRAGDRAHESISLEVLAQLDKRGDQRNLVAALASSGDLARASQLALQLPDDAASDSDRAALAIVARDHEAALVHAYRAVDRDPELSPAWWNLGLAARELGLPRVAKDAFARIVAANERGWADEAKTELASLARQIAGEDSSDLDRRGRAMLDGGPVLTADDVQQFPALSRIYFYDGLRVATSPADVDRLRPLARALDDASGTATAMAAAERVAAADFTVRAKVVAKYRELATRRASAADGAKLVQEARALGPHAADVYFGAAVLPGPVTKGIAELRAIAARWGDPWFELLVERDRIANAYPGNDLRAEPDLVAALSACTNPAWSLRCGQLGQALGALLVATGRIEEGEARMREALDAFRRARSAPHYRHARTYLAEIHRRRGRYALARAEFEEEILAAREAGECDLARYSEIGRANLAFNARDFKRARTFLPPAVPPEGCTPGADVIGLITAVDLARSTNDLRDAQVARAWVEHAKDSGPPATIAAARLVPTDPTALDALRTWLAEAKPGYENDGLRLLGYSTLISDAGTRRVWPDVLAIAKQEYRLTSEPPCLIVTSLDDDLLTVVARAGTDLVGETQVIGGREPRVPAAIVQKLATCTGIAVIARTQTHGDADLLPPAYPWWFVGDGSRSTSPPRQRRAVQVIDVRPPDVGASLAPLPSLGATTEKFDVTLAGADATPERVLAALATATYAEIHAHGIVSAANEDAAFLALSPGARGTFALDAGMIRKAKLSAAPFVVLGACRAASVASMFRERWSLPDAFLVAGARGVVAADAPIPDGDARAVLDELHRRDEAGEDPAVALAAIRAARGGWAARLMLFR